jgi:hypothetical protein
MIGVPQLCGNKNVVALNSSSGKSCLQRFAHLKLIPVSFRTIEVSKSNLERFSGSTDCCRCVGNERAKPQHWHLAGPGVERYSHHPKIGKFDH